MLAGKAKRSCSASWVASLGLPRGVCPSPYPLPAGERGLRCFCGLRVGGGLLLLYRETGEPEATVISSPHWGEDTGEGTVLAGKAKRSCSTSWVASLGLPRSVSPSPCPLPAGEGDYGVFVG